MKIIKVGELKTKIIRETCYKCDTEFEYEQKDVEQDRDGRYVKCPVCKVFITAK